jgi:hypothetical protein
MKLLHQTDFKRVWQRRDGILKIEVFTFGSGKRFNGVPATGHWKTRGYKDPKTNQMKATLKELKQTTPTE